MKQEPMKVYNCMVMLGGEVFHTVPKTRITGEEIRLLQALHGEAGVSQVKEVGMLDGWTREEEFHDLADRYSQDPSRADGRKLVEKVFGVTLFNFDAWLAKKEEDEEQRQDAAESLAAIEDAATAKGTFVRSTAKS